ELATVFEIPGSTARTWLQRAREALRAALEAEARSPSTAWSDADLDAWARDLRAREEGDDD
ncbi:MAG: RNA polymerase subunit sigma-70, partial [Myxococcales bacterium]|nr:RNA polymerase subunit sigma-70 [Myxococcales bacterium]